MGNHEKGPGKSNQSAAKAGLEWEVPHGRTHETGTGYSWRAQGPGDHLETITEKMVKDKAMEVTGPEREPGEELGTPVRSSKACHTRGTIGGGRR